MHFSMPKVALALGKKIQAQALMTPVPEKASPETKRGDRRAVIDTAGVRRFVREQETLPTGTFDGDKLSEQRAPEIRRLLDVPADEDILLAYMDRLMGQVLQCAVLTEKGAYIMDEPGHSMRLEPRQLRTVRPAIHFVICGDGDGVDVCMNRRASGFLQLVGHCAERFRA